MHKLINCVILWNRVFGFFFKDICLFGLLSVSAARHIDPDRSQRACSAFALVVKILQAAEGINR